MTTGKPRQSGSRERAVRMKLITSASAAVIAVLAIGSASDVRAALQPSDDPVLAALPGAGQGWRFLRSETKLTAVKPAYQRVIAVQNVPIPSWNSSASPFPPLDYDPAQGAPATPAPKPAKEAPTTSADAGGTATMAPPPAGPWGAPYPPPLQQPTAPTMAAPSAQGGASPPSSGTSPGSAATAQQAPQQAAQPQAAQPGQQMPWPPAPPWAGPYGYPQQPPQNWGQNAPAATSPQPGGATSAATTPPTAPQQPAPTAPAPQFPAAPAAGQMQPGSPWWQAGPMPVWPNQTQPGQAGMAPQPQAPTPPQAAPSPQSQPVPPQAAMPPAPAAPGCVCPPVTGMMPPSAQSAATQNSSPAADRPDAGKPPVVPPGPPQVAPQQAGQQWPGNPYGQPPPWWGGVVPGNQR